jgi:nucleotide-binding universal stress UspA family protein
MEVRESHMYRHVLIPTDGSELAQKAIVHGLSFAKAVGAKVTALTVEPSFNVYDVPASRANLMSAAFDEYAKFAREHAASILNGIANDAKAVGVECETVQVIHDHPYQAIVATAKEKACDLIVMASHGRSGISAIMLGSVTAKVLTHTTVPVLVYR